MSYCFQFRPHEAAQATQAAEAAEAAKAAGRKGVVLLEFVEP